MEDPVPLFAPYPSLALLYLNSARLGLSRAHNFKLILFMDVRLAIGIDLHARCSHVTVYV